MHEHGAALRTLERIDDERARAREVRGELLEGRVGDGYLQRFQVGALPGGREDDFAWHDGEDVRDAQLRVGFGTLGGGKVGHV